MDICSPYYIQYYPATHQTQPSQSQHPHSILHQPSLQSGQCNRHKGVNSMAGEAGFVAGSSMARSENGKTVHGFAVHELPHQASLRQEYHHQQPPPQQHQSATSNQQQQYQNITGNTTWLPQPNKRNSAEIDDYRQNTTQATLHRQESHSHAHANLGNHSNHPQTPQQQQSYCSKHPDSYIVSSTGNNDILEPSPLVGGGAGSYTAKKTYITPFDIPSPPPQPVLNDHKRFSSGQYTGKIVSSTSAAAATNTVAAGDPATMSNSVGSNIKSYCQCEHNVRAKNTANNHSNHNHFQQHHHLQQQHQRQQHQSAVANNIGAGTGSTSVPSHSHSHTNRHYADDTLAIPRTSSLKQSNHTPHQPQPQPQHQHQNHHHHHQQQPQYRKIDVFAAVDDDDNDTSPSIKVNV